MRFPFSREFYGISVLTIMLVDHVVQNLARGAIWKSDPQQSRNGWCYIRYFGTSRGFPMPDPLSEEDKRHMRIVIETAAMGGSFF